MGNTPLDQPLPIGVSAVDAVAELIELRRLSSRIEARKSELIEAIRVDDEANAHRLILGLDKPADRAEMLERLVRAEVSCALRVSSAVAQGAVREARALCDRLPRTLAGLRSGDLPVHFARIIIRECFTVPDDRVDAFEAAVFAGRMDVASATFRTRCRSVSNGVCKGWVSLRKETH